MGLDFWNNPVIVTALRLKYRRGSPGARTTTYLLGLVGVGVLIQRFWNTPQVPWTRCYLLAIMGLQFVISVFGSSMATASSLQAEVSQRTLDFQRLAALNPRQILLGKLLGEPSGTYILAISTIPLAVACTIAGATSLDVLLLLYLQLATISLLAGTMGLVQSLEYSPLRGAGSGRNVSLGVFLIWVTGLSLERLSRSGTLGNLSGWEMIALGLLTPLGCLVGVAQGTPWLATISYFGIAVPCLLVAPLAQLALAAFLFSGMCRRMLNPILSLIGKPMAYAALMVVDVAFAGVLYDRRPGAQSLDELTALFVAAHLSASLLLTYLSTPTKPALVSWLWRFRRREPWLAASAVGDRGDNRAAVFVFAALGLLIWLLGIWLPAYRIGSAGPLSQLDAATINLLAGSLLLATALGVTYQWFVLVANRSGAALFVVAALALILVPALIGGYLHISLLAALSPIAQVLAWASDDPWLNVGPLYALWGIVLVGSWIQLGRRIAAHQRFIERTLAAMGVPPVQEGRTAASIAGGAG
jgi:hypothetical protein